MPTLQHDWFLTAWAKTLGKRQTDFVNDLEWNRSKASLVWRGAQPYTRDMVNEVSTYLNIHPYELLMHPDDAMAIRRLRSSAKQIASVQLVADTKLDWAPEPPPHPAFKNVK